MRAGVLRIEGLAIAADLAGDSLHVVRGPVWVQRYEHHHWAGPLERLVTDALITGLGRSQAFAQVKGGGDRGGEDYVLTGRVLEFHQAASGGEWVAVATLDLTVVDSSGQLVLHAELQREARLPGAGPEYLAIALSDALGGLIDDFLARCDAAGMFDRAIDSTPPGR